MKRLLTLIGIVIVGLLILLNLIFFTVRQDQQAIVLQLGKPMKVIKEPGLNVRLPLIQEVLYFEKKLLMYDAAPAEILTQDKKNLVVDNYSEWKIIDPLKFYQTVQTISGAQSRVDDIVYSELRVELGVHSLLEILSGGRAKLMRSITEKSDKAAREYGIEVVDVRIKRADLPPENEKAVYGRMQAERERQAKKYRSEGQEEAQKTRSIADKDRAIILAEAYRESQELKGKGDAEAIRIYAEAFQKDPEFYRFTRSLEAYAKSLNKDATLVLTPENEFLDYLQGVKGPSK